MQFTVHNITHYIYKVTNQSYLLIYLGSSKADLSWNIVSYCKANKSQWITELFYKFFCSFRNFWIHLEDISCLSVMVSATRLKILQLNKIKVSCLMSNNCSNRKMLRDWSPVYNDFIPHKSYAIYAYKLCHILYFQKHTFGQNFEQRVPDEISSHFVNYQWKDTLLSNSISDHQLKIFQ